MDRARISTHLLRSPQIRVLDLHFEFDNSTPGDAIDLLIHSNTTLNAFLLTKLEHLDSFDGVSRVRRYCIILDSSGEPKSGFIYGNNFWLGSKSQCLDLENTKPLELDPVFLKSVSKYRNIDEEFPPFHLNYFIAHFYHNSTHQYQCRLRNEDLISLGLCLPASCSSDQLSRILEKMFEAKILAVGNLYSADYRLHSVRGITIILAIIGTFYDCIVHQKRLELIKSSKKIANNSDVKSTSVLQQNFLGQILLCFSVHTNTKQIFDTKESIKDVIPSLFGLRSLEMIYVCMLHTIIYAPDFLDNRVAMLRLTEGFVNQIFANGHISVDTFFCLSGFSISWAFFGKKVNVYSGAKSFRHFPWRKFFDLTLKRIIRMAPVYFMIIGITGMIFGWYNANSSFVIAENPYHNCNKYWWRNALFINNLFPWNELCMTWSWYVPCDIQFFIIGTFLLLLSEIHFYASAFLLMALLVISVIVNGLISYGYGYTATIEQMFLQPEILYSSPWMRIGPYLVGIIAGYVLRSLNGKLDLSTKILCLLWIVGSSCNISVLFGLYQRNFSPMSAAMYVAFGRIVWALGIAWIVIACHTNNAGFINKILSLKIWNPLCKLTYSAYLLNPLVTLSVAMTSESSMHLDNFRCFIYFLGLTAFTIFSAFIATILIETPCNLLFQLPNKLRKKRSVIIAARYDGKSFFKLVD
ncbi:Similar to nrf-6: Nose resistant to fluoxetine protein 6 (Caenorhabditis elegans) [Cotesia congregata]|uniref:Similar to nrf-6: Nose resistant to fluoxetine protein 6 (Caenorhabditis elegans) n=1 Tax=Cotesia congregata TaxID=51543 RepID=A0A8J2MM80_COTCN|nr:Similar to nrf-6: Nose resistant to fluoxetine protein 6 (Caenorhabditis elegans) [Cotesia congregata]